MITRRINDWLEQKEHEATDWTVVVSEDKQQENGHTTFDFFTRSVLVKNNPSTISRLLSKPEREGDIPSGLPAYDRERNVYDPMGSSIVNGMECLPIIVYKKYANSPHKYDVANNFLLYYKAMWNANDNRYECADEIGNKVPIVSFEEDANSFVIKIATHYLRDYLAVTGCVLVRYHNHMELPILGDGEECKETILIGDLKSRDFRYAIYCDPSDPISNRPCKCRLNGKDVIRPYRKPKIGFEKKEYEKFIICVDKKGRERTAPCGGKAMLDFGDTKSCKPYYMRPVYFSREVLKRYYENSNYSVEDTKILMPSGSDISFYINDEKVIHVHLGDLGLLPNKEQLHWRPFNIPPRGGVSPVLLARDLYCYPVASGDPVHGFKTALKKLNASFKGRHGGFLFQPLHKGDAHCLDSLHIPATDEHAEFDNQILYLIKITADSLNETLVRKIISDSGLPEPDREKKGSIYVLEHWLKQMKSNMNLADILRDINGLRSTGSAHRKGDNNKKILAKVKEKYGKSYDKIIESFLTELTGTMTDLTGAVDPAV